MVESTEGNTEDPLNYNSDLVAKNYTCYWGSLQWGKGGPNTFEPSYSQIIKVPVSGK